MPFVPIGPGIPFIPNNDFVSGLISLLVADALGIDFNFSTTQWGLYLDGVPVVIAESVVDMSVKTESVISNYQIEQGGFETYNKVQLPTKVQIRFASGGGAEARQELINSCAAAQQSLELFDAVMPEKTYTNINVESLDFRRSDGRSGLIVIDLHCEEVRINTTTQFSDTKSPSAESTLNSGTVQTETPTQTQTQSITNSSSPVQGFF